MQGELWIQSEECFQNLFALQVSLPCLRFMEGGKEEEEEQEEPRQYSWDLARQTLDLSQFTIDRSILAIEM